jgi:CBS domain-containing protein
MDKLTGLTVADLMATGVIAVHPRTTVDDAYAEMHAAQVRHLAVVDDRQHLVGILSDRDLLRGIGQHRRGKHPVAEFMTRDVVSIAPTARAREDAELLLERKIGALPVLGEGLALVGMITATDFLRVALKALGGDPGPR